MKALCTTTRPSRARGYNVTHRLYMTIFRMEQNRHRWDWIDVLCVILIAVTVSSLAACAVMKIGGGM